MANSRKLYYIAKEMPVDAFRRLEAMLDPCNYNDFHPHIQQFLNDPTTKNSLTLAVVPGSAFGQHNIDRFIQKYQKLFRDINTFCSENGIQPFFPDPDDVTASLAIRNDLVDTLPEAYLNRYFGVENFSDYTPPIYNPDPNNT